MAPSTGGWELPEGVRFRKGTTEGRREISRGGVEISEGWWVGGRRRQDCELRSSPVLWRRGGQTPAIKRLSTTTTRATLGSERNDGTKR